MKELDIMKRMLLPVIREVLEEALDERDEVYVSPAELSKHFGFFSTDWLRHYGHLLPRTKVAVVQDGEVIREGNYHYPLHKIGRMVAAGEFRRIEYQSKMKEA